MGYFPTMAADDKNRFNQWLGGDVNSWVDKAMALSPEFAARFSNPTEYARAVAQHMLSSTEGYRKLTPGYSQFLLQQAPSAYALQQLMAMGRYGGPAGEDFPNFWRNWLAGQHGNYGFGGLPAEDMRDLWGKFIGRYQSMLGGDTSQQYLSALDPQDLQAFHELAMKSTYGPFGQGLMGRYWDEAYNNWSNFTKATPWINFLQTAQSAGTGGLGI